MVTLNLPIAASGKDEAANRAIETLTSHVNSFNEHFLIAFCAFYLQYPLIFASSDC